MLILNGILSLLHPLAFVTTIKPVYVPGSVLAGTDKDIGDAISVSEIIFCKLFDF